MCEWKAKNRFKWSSATCGVCCLWQHSLWSNKHWLRCGTDHPTCVDPDSNFLLPHAGATALVAGMLMWPRHCQNTPTPACRCSHGWHLQCQKDRFSLAVICAQRNVSRMELHMILQFAALGGLLLCCLQTCGFCKHGMGDGSTLNIQTILLPIPMCVA